MEKLNEQYMVSVADAKQMFSRGRNRLLTDARSANACLKLGRSVRIIVPKLKQYYEEMASNH